MQGKYPLCAKFINICYLYLIPTLLFFFAKKKRPISKLSFRTKKYLLKSKFYVNWHETCSLHNVKNSRNPRKVQIDTFKRYKANGFVFPDDIPANLCDRIHAYILWRCEGKYGPKFWPDFFKQINAEYDKLSAAVALSNGDKIRNERYRITIECFDRLEGVNFKQMLKEYHISLTTDVKSLHPTESGWNRKFYPADEAVLYNRKTN